MRVLITGANGFSGQQLQKLLKKDKNLEIHLTDITDCNLINAQEVETLLQKVMPDQIYHLAGTFTNQYQIDYECNVSSTKNILDFLVSFKHPCRVLLIGSAAEYGIPNSNPIQETHSLNPRTVYGLTKVFQTELMQFYNRVHGLDIVMARTFNLKGIGAPKQLFIGSLYAQIEEIRNGKKERISLGDVRAERDYIDIEAAVLQYRNIMANGIAGEIYNVASGKPVKIEKLLDEVLKESALKKEIVDFNNSHKIGVPQIYADISKLIAL